MGKANFRTWVKRIIILFLSLYILFCGLFYFLQDKILFHPEKLDKEFVFSFKQDFEEIYIKTSDDKILHGLLFTADNPKGLIFYLHGNAGTLESWGSLARYYTNMNYDVFMPDYRGFGKSEGRIISESQLFDDTQAAYDEMKKRYDESKIVVLGYSIGTGLATHVASKNNPRMLILQTPYYSITYVAQSFCPMIPAFAVRYKLETYKYIQDCKMPIVIYHGNKDRTINYSNSMKLKQFLKPTDKLIILAGQGHAGITENPVYLESLKEVLR